MILLITVGYKGVCNISAAFVRIDPPVVVGCSLKYGHGGKKNNNNHKGGTRPSSAEEY